MPEENLMYRQRDSQLYLPVQEILLNTRQDIISRATLQQLKISVPFFEGFLFPAAMLPMVPKAAKPPGQKQENIGEGNLGC